MTNKSGALCCAGGATAGMANRYCRGCKGLCRWKPSAVQFLAFNRRWCRGPGWGGCSSRVPAESDSQGGDSSTSQLTPDGCPAANANCVLTLLQSMRSGAHPCHPTIVSLTVLGRSAAVGGVQAAVPCLVEGQCRSCVALQQQQQQQQGQQQGQRH